MTEVLVRLLILVVGLSLGMGLGIVLVVELQRHRFENDVKTLQEGSEVLRKIREAKDRIAEGMSVEDAIKDLPEPMRKRWEEALKKGKK